MEGAESVLFLMFFAVMGLGCLVGIIQLVGMWASFDKAGKPGWAAIIPVYNMVVMVEISGRPLWWVILFFVPVANIVAVIVVSIDVAQNFGKGGGFGVGLAFLPWLFWPILGFGSARYQGGQVNAGGYGSPL